jgi:hypothetical protein
MTFSETTRRDIEIVTSTGMVQMTDGDFAFVAGDAAIQQAIVFTLQLTQGEWFANLTAGIPWFTDVLGTKFNLDQIRSIFQTKVAAVEGVLAIKRLAISFDNAARALTVEYEIQTIFSDSLNVTTQLATVARSVL